MTFISSMVPAFFQDFRAGHHRYWGPGRGGMVCAGDLLPTSQRFHRELGLRVARRLDRCTLAVSWLEGSAEWSLEMGKWLSSYAELGGGVLGVTELDGTWMTWRLEEVVCLCGSCRVATTSFFVCFFWLASVKNQHEHQGSGSPRMIQTFDPCIF